MDLRSEHEQYVSTEEHEAVLILILMDLRSEYSLKQAKVKFKNGLNPCFNGLAL